MRYVIGLDAGTTCFKAGLYDEKLNTIIIESYEYRLIYSDNFVEMKPEDFWQIFCRLIKSLLKKSGVTPDDIVGLSICSQGETLIILDNDGEPLRNAIIWTDTRAISQAEKLKEQFPDREIFDITGQREVTAMWPASKLLWIKENEPIIFEKCAHVLLLEDYLIYRLTGLFATDKSISSSTVYLDIYKGVWWDKMLSAIGINESMLPKIYESGTPVGKLSEKGAFECGLSVKTIVSSGALDQASGMLGAGNINAGTITETTGTCLAVCANVGDKRLSFDDGLLPTHYGIIKGTYYTIFWSAAAGSIYRWVRDVFYKKDNSDNLFKLIDEEADSVPPGCEGLMLMPYLSGLNYPFTAENAKGSFEGISLTHRREHFARAVLESIAFLLKQSVDEISNYGIDVKEIFSLGGGSSSKLWNQIKADVTDKTIYVLKDDEVTCKGAAIMAAVGCGIFNEFKNAVKQTVSINKVFSPDETEIYKEIYSEFIKKSEIYYNNIKQNR